MTHVATARERDQYINAEVRALVKNAGNGTLWQSAHGNAQSAPEPGGVLALY